MAHFFEPIPRPAWQPPRVVLATLLPARVHVVASAGPGSPLSLMLNYAWWQRATVTERRQSFAELCNPARGVSGWGPAASWPHLMAALAAGEVPITPPPRF